ncbi:MAG: dienelactone hydrolase family protein [Chloroflexota bacterium]|nr:dienelactone hydrolase family protein [Chloroflexota bacterium]
MNKGKIAHTVQEAEELNSERNVEETAMTLLRALEYVQQLPSVNRAGLGVVGWSLGAFWTIRLSAMVPDAIRAAVLFYGTGETDFGQAKAAFLGHFAEQDPWEPLDDVRQMETAMRQAGVQLTLHIYPEVGHWFFEDDRREHYDPAAAVLAWQRTIEFLRAHLSGA